jgi:hypothetical protein
MQPEVGGLNVGQVVGPANDVELQLHHGWELGSPVEITKAAVIFK